MASKTNFDLKGRTHPLTSAISLKIKNAPQMMRTETRTVRILININSNTYLSSHKVKIMASPIMNNITRIRPEQNKFYFTGFEKKYVERTVFTLKNPDKNDDLMIIEVSACKGNFIYTLTKTAPLDSETYMDLKKREIPSRIYSSNGKKIITVRNIEENEYFLTLFGANNKRDIDYILDQDKDPNQRPKGGNEVDVLFFYYTTTEKEYKYLVTNDLLNYESSDDFFSVKFNIPELKKRDTFGRENYADAMNYTFIVSNKKSDFVYMESICYLTKLEQNNGINKFEDLKIQYNEEENTFKVEGLNLGKPYYMNILGKNTITGEIITYKPVMILYTLTRRRIKIGITIVLTLIVICFLYAAYSIYRKYRLQKMQLNFVEESNDSSINRRFGKSKNIGMDFIKENYNDMPEDKQGLSIND
jgi:hypothetical protein